MYTQKVKTKGNSSKAVANSIIQRRNNGKQDFGFVDNRPEAIVQRKLQEVANNSPLTKQTVQLEVITNKSIIQPRQPVQRKEKNKKLIDSRKNDIGSQSDYSGTNARKRKGISNNNGGIVQQVSWSPAANRAPLDEIRDFQAGSRGNRPKINAGKLRDFKKVQDILHNSEAVNHHMGGLNTDIENILKRKKNKLTPRQALLSVLKVAETTQGYNPKVGTITADDGTDPKLGAQKLSDFGKAGKAFQDFGVSGEQHGPDTHRIQQYILYKENERRKMEDKRNRTNTSFENDHGALGVYRDMADYRYAVHTNQYKLNKHSPDRAGRSKIYAWEMLLDRVNGKKGVDVIDHRSETKDPLQPDAGYPIHFMEAMKKGNYGSSVAAAAHEGKTAQENHMKQLDQVKKLKTGGTSLLGGIGLGTIASVGLGLTGWPLALATGTGALGGYLYGKSKWK